MLLITVLRHCIAAAAIWMLSVPAGAQDTDLAHFPFWQTSAGWWRSENTYFDQDLDYKIRSYNSVTHIEIEGRRLRETEYKSYAPSELATALGSGLIAGDEGIEAITVTTGELVDDRGTVHITGSRPVLAGMPTRCSSRCRRPTGATSPITASSARPRTRVPRAPATCAASPCFAAGRTGGHGAGPEEACAGSSM